MNRNLIVYFKKSGTRFKAEYYSSPTGIISTAEAWEYFKENPDIDLEIRRPEKVEAERRDPKEHLMRMLRVAESERGSVEFLNRIIRNGGLINYTKKLESAE